MYIKRIPLICFTLSKWKWSTFGVVSLLLLSLIHKKYFFFFFLKLKINKNFFLEIFIIFQQQKKCYLCRSNGITYTQWGILMYHLYEFGGFTLVSYTLFSFLFLLLLIFSRSLAHHFRKRIPNCLHTRLEGGHFVEFINFLNHQSSQKHSVSFDTQS